MSHNPKSETLVVVHCNSNQGSMFLKSLCQMFSRIFRNICVQTYTYMYLLKVNNKRGHDLERKSGGVYGMV